MECVDISMDVDKNFTNNKKNSMKKLDLAKKENKVDSGIIPIIDLINNSDKYYTSSSCAGRIVLIELPRIGDKVNAKFLGKWHRKINLNDIKSAFEKASKGYIFFLAQSPIIHVYCSSSDDADGLIKQAVSSGFKHSGIKTLKNKFIVEINSTERIDTPVGIDGNFFCDDDFLELLIKISNDIYDKSTKKLSRLKYNFKEMFKY